MKSLNFEFLRDARPELADLGAFAEQYAHPDPPSALVKLRSFVEQAVQGIYGEQRLPRIADGSLIDLLNNESFRSTVPRVVLDKFHLVRMRGNKAAHGADPGPGTALEVLREAWDIARWLFVTFYGGTVETCPEYQEPPEGGLVGETKARLKREKREALERLAAQEARLQEVLAELEQQRALAASAPASDSRVEAYDAAPAEPRVRYSLPPVRVFRQGPRTDDNASVQARGQSTADALAFSEAETRKRLIDSQLVEVGWNVAADGSDTDQVGQEVEVRHQPTTTGKGAVDYVLWDDDGQPLAVIEAKKTSVDPEIGRKQAALYADGLEKMHGHRPIIVYTNGFETWMWDDVLGYPPRKLFGFYSKDSLQRVVRFQRRHRQSLDTISPDAEIAARGYQIEALRAVSERFQTGYRKALIVQATGTGKTRVAISLAEMLIRAGWVERVLFLCDRRELRKQARDTFAEHLAAAPLTIVGAKTYRDRNKRVYLATYPAMLKVFHSFDVGFFDLIIADESHRSIYNVYGDLFRYFDALQVGLTATPVEFVARNTFRLFNCEDQDPTAYYPYERAVNEGHLVPFEVFTHTTHFLRRGIRYAELTQEQRDQLEAEGEDPKLFDYDVPDLDKRILNKDTNRAVLRNLMENGIREGTGQHPGKTIVFARNHNHAMLLRQLFDEMYPQYRGKFCQVIDNYDPRAEQLIDDFKGSGTNEDLTIAISVDMLDTGVDVPEVVNLVFAKPIQSKVKFWQMIGRGTRLRPDLFGEGRHKSRFRIFDHWGNFDYFDLAGEPAEPSSGKPLMQQVFEARIELGETALQQSEPAVFEQVADLLLGDINRLPEESISVREKWREKRTAASPEVVHAFTPQTVLMLRQEIAPLMQWVDIRRSAEALQLDLLIARMQTECLRKSGRLDDLKVVLLERVGALQMHLNPVREKAGTIKQVKDPAFWAAVTAGDLEQVRRELRDIIHYRNKPTGPHGGIPPKVVDIKEDAAGYRLAQRSASIPEIDMAAYRQKVEEVLGSLFDTDPTLAKIRRGEPVAESDLERLASLVLTQHRDVDLGVLREFYPETAAPLDFLIRRVVGLEPEVVAARFAEFSRKHPKLSAKQVRFLGLLQSHIARHGAVEVARLYDDPFTMVDADGLEGVFPEPDQADELVAVIESFQPQSPGETRPQ